MLSTIFKINFLNLRRDKAAFVLTFVLPIAFFSIFAMIFGRMDRDTRDNRIKVEVADRDGTEMSRKFVAALQQERQVDVSLATGETEARKAVHDGKFAAAIVLLEGFGASIGNAQERDSVELIYDAANPIAQSAVSGLIQGAVMMSAAPSMRAVFSRG